MNLKLISEVFSAVKEYLFSHQKFTNKFSTINNIDDLGIFIRQRSSFVTQTTLYGYLKTRMGLKYTLMFSDDIFLQSINKSKWNIFVEALGDLTLFTVSNLMSKGKINDFNLSNFYNNILDEEIKNQMSPEFVQIAKESAFFQETEIDFLRSFLQRADDVKYAQQKPDLGEGETELSLLRRFFEDTKLVEEEV